MENKLDDEEEFSLDVTEDMTLSGYKPDRENQDMTFQVFYPLRDNSMSHIWLSAAWNHDSLQYVVFVNDVPFGFKTPLGWSFIPFKDYAAGKIPAKFKETYVGGYEVFLQVRNRGH